MTVTVLLILLCASIDFGRAFSDMQAMSELTRQGSNLASRGSSLPQAVAAVVTGESGLDLKDFGDVIITSVTNKKNVYTISGQDSSTKDGLTSLSQTSKVGSAVGGPATLPTAAQNSIQDGQTIFVTEIYYPSRRPLNRSANENAIDLPSIYMASRTSKRIEVNLLDQGKIRKNAPGQIFVLMCFALFVLLGFVGLAIDLGQAYIVKTTLSKAVDAAALTAMRNVGDISGREAIATNAFNANYSTVPGLGNPPTPSVVFSLDGNGNTIVTVTATASVTTSFIRIFG